jgi:NAD(P)-dependent dehydrogenase (short-subunit alcohol dehydrogenase family)
MEADGMNNGSPFSLAGKNVLLTGATGHLGSEMARGLACAGAHVLVNSRSHERAAMLVAELRGAGFSATEAVFDVTKAEEVEGYARSLDMPLSVLVNNAYSGGAGTVKTAEPEQYVEAYRVSVVAVQMAMCAFQSHFRRAVQMHGDASVINIASMYGLVSPDLRVYDSPQGSNPPFYGAAKAALLQWTRYAACEFGQERIRVNAITPGPFPSAEVQSSETALIARLASKVPLGRMGSPEELVGPLVFLASSASSFVNGANLVVDGGWTAW